VKTLLILVVVLLVVVIASLFLMGADNENKDIGRYQAFLLHKKIQSGICFLF